MKHQSEIYVLKRTLSSLLMGFIIAFTAYSAHASSQPEPSVNTRHVIIDTDVDTDDAMAILYLMNAPGIQVDAVTVTGTGFMFQVDGVPTALKLASLGGSPKLPVSYGANSPIVPFGDFPKKWRKEALKFYAHAGLPDIHTAPDPRLSAQLMVEIIRESPNKVTILGLGPMTNIALALQMAPDIVENIETIVMSAGAFAPHKGNIVTVAPVTTIEETASYRALASLSDEKNTAEYNVLLDAAAFSVILQCGAPVLISPLNASDHAAVTDTVLDPLKGKGNPVADFVVGVVEPLLEQNVPTYFWDPVAASMIVDSEICTNLQNTKVLVEIHDKKTYGTTIKSPSGNEVDVCLDIDSGRFYDSFIKTIKAAH